MMTDWIMRKKLILLLYIKVTAPGGFTKAFINNPLHISNISLNLYVVARH